MLFRDDQEQSGAIASVDGCLSVRPLLDMVPVRICIDVL